MYSKLLICLALTIFTLPTLAAGKLRILLTNDDGFEAPGIRAVHKALLAAGHDVYMIAPATQQSGSSAGITSGGVEVTAYPGKIWAVHGKPADSVRVGLGHIMWDNPPDLVVAGANLGQNTGADIKLSGTIGAAVTALDFGIPAIAISVEIRLDEARTRYPTTVSSFPRAAELVNRVISNLDINTFNAILNINYPARLPLDIRGVRWSQISNFSLLTKRYHQKPDGKYAYEFQNPHPNARKNDAESLVDGYVTLTLLDGNSSIFPSRSDKKLATGLLTGNTIEEESEGLSLKQLLKFGRRDDEPVSKPDPAPVPVRDPVKVKERDIEKVIPRTAGHVVKESATQTDDPTPKKQAKSYSDINAGNGSTSSEPVTPAPVTLLPPRPLAVEPAAVEPAAVEPAAVEPAAVEPAAVEPAAVEPAAVEPAVEQPEAVPIAIPPAAPEAKTEATPEAIPVAAPEAIPVAAPEAVTEAIPEAVTEAVPDALEAVETAPQSTNEARSDPAETPVRKEPDSWLRRIFDPSSWRR